MLEEEEGGGEGRGGRRREEYEQTGHLAFCGSAV